MRRILLICLLVSAQAWALNPTFVKASGAGISTVAANSVTVTTTSTAGNSIVLAVEAIDTVPIFVSDSAGNTYTQQVVVDNSAAVATNKAYLFTSPLSASAATSFKVCANNVGCTGATTTFLYLVVLEYSNVTAYGLNTSGQSAAVQVTTNTLGITTQDTNNTVVKALFLNQSVSTTLTWTAGTGRIVCSSASTPVCATTTISAKTGDIFYAGDGTAASASVVNVTETWTGASEVTEAALELRSNNVAAPAGGNAPRRALRGAGALNDNRWAWLKEERSC